MQGRRPWEFAKVRVLGALPAQVERFDKGFGLDDSLNHPECGG